jgi:hypothetical protein
MKRQILRLAGVAAIAAGGLLAPLSATLLAPAAVAQADSANGNRFTHIYQRTTVVCGNAIAIDAVVLTRCDGSAGTYDADLDRLRGIFDLDLDFTGDSVDDDAGRWFHIDSRTWS